MTAEVVLPLPLESAYTYRVPPALDAAAQPGARVLVPFRRKKLTGVVVTRGAEAPEGMRLKPVADVLDPPDRPALTPELLRLTRWIASYYVCAWGEVIKAALPAGIDAQTQTRVRRTERTAALWMAHKEAAPVLTYLNDHPDVTLAGLRKAAGDVSLDLLRQLEAEGLVELERHVRGPQVSVKTEPHVRLTDAATPEKVEALRGAKQQAVMETLAHLAQDGQPHPRRADVLAEAGASTSTMKSLVEKGLVEETDEEVLRTPLGAVPKPAGPPPEKTLHPDQERALEAIGGAIEEERFETFLLKGVTGSGKTEVYIRALKRTIAAGKTGIVLVPEIALTPQTVARFRAHFPEGVAVLHSRMSAGERFDAWRSLREGRFQIAIGPRSAVLAPLENLGLIVVDEEHESSYKQFDPNPRYHARDVAVLRAQMNGAVCVLGSATPSLESVLNAEIGRYTLLQMPQRVPRADGTRAQLPPVKVVDLATERLKHRLDGALSHTLVEALQERLERGEQAILLQNRRGFAPVLACEACGHAPECRDCSVPMTFHKAQRHLRCHYCGRTERRPHRCPECQRGGLEEVGVGTQRVEEELQRRLPEARLLRMDLDTTRRKDAHHKLLSQFGRGEADILVGTQMVAKGLDFPKVTLVGVVDADAGMLLPDFRAEERTFQLLTQVAGRAGRAERPGEVLLQTRAADHPLFHFVGQHDHDGFARAALFERREFAYPPYGRLAGVAFRGEDERLTESVARQWTAAIPLQEGVEVLGPQPAFVARVKRQYRFHTILKASREASGLSLQRLLRTAHADVTVPRGVHVGIDVDAVGLF